MLLPLSKIIAPSLVTFDDELVWWCTAPDDVEPPTPPSAEEDPPSDDPGLDGAGGGGNPSCTTGSRHFIQMVGSGTTGTAEYHGHGSYAGNSAGDTLRRRLWWYLDGVRVISGAHGTNTSPSNSWDSNSNGQSNVQLQNDDNQWSWRARFANITVGGEKNGSTYFFKTHAFAMTTDTPTASSVEDTTAGISCDFVPNSRHSTVTVQMEYKKTSDAIWTVAGSTADTNGYSSVSITRGITGLDPETQYDFRCVLSRNSVNDTSLTSVQATFTTIASVASVTTDDAGGIGFTAATMNGTVDHNTVDGVLSWRYHTSDPGAADDSTGTEVGSVSFTADGSGSVQTGTLSASTTYYYWAIYDPSGTAATVFGAIKNFTTPSDPGTDSAAGEMLQVQHFDRKWGVATTLFFVVPQNAGSSSDLIFDGAAVWGSGETKLTGIVYDDDSTPTLTAEANTASNPARVASTSLYRLDLSATEMQHDELYITLTNAGTSVRDVLLTVRTHLMLSTYDIDASAKSTNTTAVTVTGNGTGSAISFIGGDSDGKDIEGILASHTLNFGTVAVANSTSSVDLDNSTAIQTDDFYNGATILFYEAGTGPGQARIIEDYTGTSYEAKLNFPLETGVSSSTRYIIVPASDWNRISPIVELAALPTISSNYADFIQFLFQRFVYKRTQTATTFTMKQDDGSTSFASNAVDDDGTTQTHNEMGDL